MSDNPLLCTPGLYVETVRRFFGGTIDVDPCPNRCSVVKATYEFYRPERDGLRDPWSMPLFDELAASSRVFVNPPWGLDFETDGATLAPWLDKCAEEMKRGAEIVALVPTTPGSGCWRKHVLPVVKAICFVDDTAPIRLVVDDKAYAIVPVSFLYYGHRPNYFAHGTHPARGVGFEGFSRLGSVWVPA